MTDREFITAVEKLNCLWRILAGGEIRTVEKPAHSPLSAVYAAKFGERRSPEKWLEIASALGLSDKVATAIHRASDMIPPYIYEVRRDLIAVVKPKRNKQRPRKPRPIAEPFKEVSP